MRALIALPLLWLATRLVGGGSTIWPQNVYAVGVRTVCMLCALTFFFSSISVFGIAYAAAGLYTAPLFIAVFSHFCLDEQVGPRRALAIVLGFIGALLVLQPQGGKLSILHLLPILAGAAYAMGLMATRRLCAAESAFTLTAGTQAAYAVAGVLGCWWLAAMPPSEALSGSVPFLFHAWAQPEADVIAIVVLTGLLNVLAHTGMSRAYQQAETSFLAPFDYSYLAFATLWGILVWEEKITAWGFAGIALIAVAGVYIAWREHTALEMASRLLKQ